MSKLETALALHIRARKLPEPVPEYRFAAEAAGGPGKGLRARLAAAGLKDWRFDFAYPELRLAIECEGGIHSGGRHVRGVGYEEDLAKYNAAVLLGWDVVRFSGGMVTSGQAVETIRKLIELKGVGNG